MAVVSQPTTLDTHSPIQTCYPTPIFTNIPSINLSSPDSKSLTVEACQEYGFFRVRNHGVPLELMKRLEEEAIKFFDLSQCEKDKAVGFGYGNRKIGPNGDMGWVEYLLLSASSPNGLIHQLSTFVSKENPEFFMEAFNDYASAMKRVACEILEIIAEGLRIEPKTVFSNLLMAPNSDSLIRLNHYPPCPDHLQELGGQNVVGFGEHTDPQLISVLRSNNTSGLEICLDNGEWVSVPPDQDSLFISVGDCLQVMTNGRFKSVRHRVSANGLSSRISFIYFGGPPLSQKIAPLPSLMEEGEEALYQEFTWGDYKKSAYNSKLGDNRLGNFEKF